MHTNQSATREESLHLAGFEITKLTEILEIVKSHYVYDTDHNHTETATPYSIALRNLAEAYGKLENYQKQKELLVEALEINRKGANYIETARTLHKLGNVNYNSRDLEKAKECYEEVLEIRRSSR